MNRVSEWLWRQIAKLAVANRGRIMTYALKRPYSHIEKDGSMYMMRYWVFNPYDLTGKSWWRFLPSVRLHWICNPDQDRHLHTHPWNARTIILDGWYVENREGVRYGRQEGDTASIKFDQCHAIEELHPEGAWTLFITWKYRGTWGFNVDGVKVPWREYLARYNSKDNS